MSILIDKNTKVIIQGITGKQGAKACKEMLDYGTKVLCGVTPGKAGQDIEGRPVYNNVGDALKVFPDVNTSLVSVPPFAVKDAVVEAIDNGIKLINILTEKVPIQDSARIYSYAKKNNAVVVGSSSVGIISPGEGKIGSIGGGNPDRVYQKGEVGLLSKSGGMCSETSWLLKQNDIGVSTVVGLGGDIISCCTYGDLLKMFERDNKTKAVVIFGEIGGTYEEQAAEMIKKGEFTKPVVAFISGKFAESLPAGSKLGHAGALIENGVGSYKSKIKSLKEAGCKVAKAHHEIAELVKEVLK